MTLRRPRLCAGTRRPSSPSCFAAILEGWKTSSRPTASIGWLVRASHCPSSHLVPHRKLSCPRRAGTSVPAALAGHQRFTYNGSADGGILNYIATEGDTVAWSNPFQSERIHVCAHKDLAVATPLNKTVSVACHSYLQPSNPEASPSEQLISKLKWFVGQMSEGAETTGTAWTGEHTQGKWFVVDLSDHGRVCVRSPLNDRSLHLATHLTVIQYGDSFRSRWNTTVCATATIKTMRCGTGNCRGPTQATVPGARSAGTRMIRH